MSSVRVNFAANLAGQAWVTLTQLLVIPLYIKLLGIEAYGLMGFFVALQATVQILDLGLSATVTREIARCRSLDGGLADARSLMKTVSIAYIALATMICLVVVLAAPLLATRVIHAESLDPAAVRDSVMLMGLLIPVMWGTNLCNAVLMGLERQVQVNILRTAMVTASALGAVLVLWLVSADIRAFFLWQLCAGLATWAAAAWLSLRALPVGAARFRPGLLRALWRFAAGMSAISVGGIVLMQLDKWVLISLLPLSSYGHYMLALALANALYFVITPLFSSIFPRMSLLHAQRDLPAQSRLYHSSAQFIAAMVLPLATVISLFSEPILMLWIRDADVARNAAPIAGIFVWGTALNGLMNVPYALQLAEGRPSIALKLVALKLVLFVPAIVLLTLEFGVIGAATAWCALNALYVIVGVPFTHAHLLKGEATKWLVNDVIPPAAAALTVGAIAYTMRPADKAGVVMFSFLAVTTLTALAAAAFASKAPRSWALAQAGRMGILRTPR